MDWPVAVVTCAGVLSGGLFLAVVVWQVMAVGQTAVVQDAQKEIAINIKRETEGVLAELRGVISEMVSGQREVTEGVTDLQARLAAIEKLLKEVG